MESTILRRDVYEALATGEPFDMVFVTCNRKKGTGGDLVSVESWMRVQAPGCQKEGLPQMVLPSGDATKKDPAHLHHGTVNIFNPANSQLHPVKVHYDLIQFFNGKRVIN